MIETEWRRTVGGKVIVRLPKTSTRKSYFAWAQLIERVDVNLRVYGALAWTGKHYRAGADLEEGALYPAGSTHDPVVLERTTAPPLEPGSRTPRGRWRELSILWQWQPVRGVWRELGRCEGSPLDSAPELRQLARRALRQELWRETEEAEAAADRIHLVLESEYAQLGESRRAVVAILHGLLTTRMLAEEEIVEVVAPVRSGASVGSRSLKRSA